MSTFRVDNPSELIYADFQKIVEASEKGFSMLLKEVINCATKDWRDFVRGELSKGGGVLYKYISKEEKAYLNVDISKFCVSNFNPSEVLNQQAKNWSKLWAPPDPDLKQCCADSLYAFHMFAATFTGAYQYTVDMFRSGLKGYRRESPGVDIWRASELKALPNSC
jgi:hypothetical protein